jgi:hypothetical protein
MVHWLLHIFLDQTLDLVLMLILEVTRSRIYPVCIHKLYVSVKYSRYLAYCVSSCSGWNIRCVRAVMMIIISHTHHYALARNTRSREYIELMILLTHLLIFFFFKHFYFLMRIYTHINAITINPHIHTRMHLYIYT